MQTPTSKLNAAGFECPHCGFHHLLLNVLLQDQVAQCFRAGAEACPIVCPECDLTHEYCRTDLKAFRLAEVGNRSSLR
jgi:predicted RNA-binding Zn-ribbon protein involved in translation (DUF1610 family)